MLTFGNTPEAAFVARIDGLTADAAGAVCADCVAGGDGGRTNPGASTISAATAASPSRSDVTRPPIINSTDGRPAALRAQDLLDQGLRHLLAAFGELLLPLRGERERAGEPRDLVAEQARAEDDVLGVCHRNGRGARAASRRGRAAAGAPSCERSSSLRVA